MHNLRLRQDNDVLDSDQLCTVAEREMLSFVDSVVNLFGSEHAKFLAEIWLEELATMDRMPGPTSSEWRLVSLFASARLAGRLMSLQRRPAWEQKDRVM